MTDWQHNLIAIANRWPRIALQLQQQQANAEIRQLETPEGPSVVYRGVSMHSQYRPRTEAKRWLSANLKPACNAAVFFGLGLGYQIEEFLRLRPESPLLVVELDLSFLRAVLERYNLSAIWQTNRLQLCTGAAAFAAQLSSFCDRRPQLLQLPALNKLANREYRHLGQALLRFSEQETMRQNTCRRFDSLWQRNIGANAAFFSHAADAGALFGRLRGLPALLLAAGPSLHGYLHHLPELRERLLLLCVDTVLPLLQAQKVLPDLVFSVDPQLVNSFHLRPAGCADAYLVIDPACHPSVLRLPWRQLLVSASAIPAMKEFQRRFNWPQTMVFSGGTVASFAWSWARQSQLSPLVLAGYDFAFSGGLGHCPNTLVQRQRWHQSERWQPLEQLNWLAVNNHETLAGQDQHQTLWQSSRQLRTYAGWMEQQLAQRPPTWQLLGTAPVRGPQLAGTQAVDLAQLLELPRQRPQIQQLLQRPLPANGPAAAALAAWR